MQTVAERQKLSAGNRNGLLLVLPFWAGVAWLIYTL
jgi:hypothetical protein